MIFYFTGTGNSFHAAKTIADQLGEKFVPIAKERGGQKNQYEYTVKEREYIGFVFPVYAWAPPKLVVEFIKKLTISGGRPYVFSVSTCGGSEGNATSVLKAHLKKQGIILNSGFTIKMPNNYILGMDVSPVNVTEALLKTAENTLVEIIGHLKKREENLYMLQKGSLGFIKSSIVSPLFNAFALNAKSYYATDDCTGCGICQRVCPINTITVLGKPVWKETCTQCMACIHRCPEKAIQIGKGTLSKGRYVHPGIKDMPL